VNRRFGGTYHVYIQVRKLSGLETGLQHMAAFVPEHDNMTLPVTRHFVVLYFHGNLCTPFS
jgi:hypothetical protein